MKKRFIFSLPVISFLMIGCANNQPQVKEIIYKPSLNEKKAISILIYKQEQLEKRVAKLEGKKISNQENKVSKKVQKVVKLNKCNFSKPQVASKYCNSIDTKSIYIAKTDVNIRRCATVNSPIVGKIKQGTGVKFVYCNKYCWCLLDNKKGYVSYKLFIKKAEPLVQKETKKIEEVEKIENKQKKAQEITKSKKKEMNVDEVIKNYINSK